MKKNILFLISFALFISGCATINTNKFYLKNKNKTVSIRDFVSHIDKSQKIIDIEQEISLQSSSMLQQLLYKGVKEDYLFKFNEDYKDNTINANVFPQNVFQYIIFLQERKIAQIKLGKNGKNNILKTIFITQEKKDNLDFHSLMEKTFKINSLPSLFDTIEDKTGFKIIDKTTKDINIKIVSSRDYTLKKILFTIMHQSKKNQVFVFFSLKNKEIILSNNKFLLHFNNPIFFDQAKQIVPTKDIKLNNYISFGEKLKASWDIALLKQKELKYKNFVFAVLDANGNYKLIKNDKNSKIKIFLYSLENYRKYIVITPDKIYDIYSNNNTVNINNKTKIIFF